MINTLENQQKTLYVHISTVSQGSAQLILPFNTFLEQEISVLNTATAEQ